MSDECGPGLSAEGVARKEAILGELLYAQRQRTVRRRSAKAGAAIIGVAVVGIAGWAAVQGVTPASGPRITRSAPPIPPPSIPDQSHRESTSLIQVVANEPGIMERLTASPASSPARIIGDRELDEALVRVGRMPGSIRAGGKFILASDVPQPRGAEPGSG